MGTFHFDTSDFDLSSHLPNSLPVFSALFLAVSPPNFCSSNKCFHFSQDYKGPALASVFF